MKLDFNSMIFSISAGLDAVEREFTNVDAQHGGHVAYLSLKIAEQLELSKDELYSLAAAAILHDNAVTEYLAEERTKKIGIDLFLGRFKLNHSNANFATILSLSILRAFGMNNSLINHCIKGEDNVKCLPFYNDIKHVILYHHENINGTGPFRKKGDNIPVLAQIIHIADIADMYITPSIFSKSVYDDLLAFLDKRSNKLFSQHMVEAFKNSVSFEDLNRLLSNDAFDLIREILPPRITEFTNSEVKNFAGILAKITDYKSHFTSCHSSGIADKVNRMGEYYGYDEDMCTKLYLAGALHDIGKLMTPTRILEKPDRLTAEEFEVMKEHAKYSYEILKNFIGMEEEMSWAYLHHEKLDGSGYPFGKSANELNKHHRLMACVDIYQALTEPRPYKEGLSHSVSMGILMDMASKNQIDKDIVEDIDKCFGKQ